MPEPLSSEPEFVEASDPDDLTVPVGTVLHALLVDAFIEVDTDDPDAAWSDFADAALLTLAGYLAGAVRLL